MGTAQIDAATQGLHIVRRIFSISSIVYAGYNWQIFGEIHSRMD